MATRGESNSIGLIEVPQKACYGVQSSRTKNNFHVTGRPLHSEFVKNLARIEKAAAFTNMTAHVLDGRTDNAIVQACDEIIEGRLRPQFIMDAIQDGADTSASMNTNEVIANRAIEILGDERGDYSIVRLNDHVNVAQSTNNVIPCAGKLIALDLLPGPTDELDRLQKALHQKSIKFDDVVKMGGIQFQDMVPIRLDQSFEAHTAVVGRDVRRIREQIDKLKYLSIGTAAVGTTINMNPVYLFHIIRNISLVCGTGYVQADDLFDATQNLDYFVRTPSIPRMCTVNLSEMCNDLRLLSSGPRAGLGEVNPPPKQSGSSIIPGKINPVIPEVVSQVMFNVIGNDVMITMAAEAEQMELNAFEPVIFYEIFESIDTTKGTVEILINNCTLGITASRERCRKLVESDTTLATMLCPALGYKRSTEIAKRSTRAGIPVRRLVLKEGLMTGAQLDQHLNLKDMIQPGHQVEYHKMGEAPIQSHKES